MSKYCTRVPRTGHARKDPIGRAEPFGQSENEIFACICYARWKMDVSELCLNSHSSCSTNIPRDAMEGNRRCIALPCAPSKKALMPRNSRPQSSGCFSFTLPLSLSRSLRATHTWCSPQVPFADHSTGAAKTSVNIAPESRRMKVVYLCHIPWCHIGCICSSCLEHNIHIWRALITFI